MCSEPSDLGYLQECKMCPGRNGIMFHVLKLQDIEGTEEITYATWDNGNLIKKTVSISVFKDELSVWTMKDSTHVYVTNIQRKAIKAEGENAKEDPYHLVLQIDFAENCAVIHNKAVQGNHWVNHQISIFTSVSYQGDSTQSFAVISDDQKHDSAYALLAVKLWFNKELPLYQTVPLATLKIAFNYMN